MDKLRADASQSTGGGCFKEMILGIPLTHCPPQTLSVPHFDLAHRPSAGATARGNRFRPAFEPSHPPLPPGGPNAEWAAAVVAARQANRPDTKVETAGVEGAPSTPAADGGAGGERGAEKCGPGGVGAVSPHTVLSPGRSCCCDVGDGSVDGAVGAGRDTLESVDGMAGMDGVDTGCHFDFLDDPLLRLVLTCCSAQVGVRPGTAV